MTRMPRSQYASVYGPTAGDRIRLADTELWVQVLKSGFVAWGLTGSGSGSTRLTQPRVMKAYFGGMGGAPRRLSTVFVSQACLDDRGAAAALPRGVRYSPIENSRGLTRHEMVANSAVPEVRVPTTPDAVLVDGRPVPVHHAAELPLTRLQNLA